MNHPEGSTWRRWDLHVHTPESMGTHYGVGGSDKWESFMSDLESLPADIKVIGVNDYIFLDGYKRLLLEKERGRISNIELLLPVIEMRLDKFGGSAGKLSRVNYHIIFSEELDPEIIQAQFLNALSVHYILTPQYQSLKPDWQALPTRDSLEDLGNRIIASSPPEERHNFKSPLEEGFNNLNISLDGIHQALRVHYFRERYITAVGKTEWADIEWNDHTIAEKKNVINSAGIVFSSASDPEQLEAGRHKLRTSGVNGHLLDCSDAHYLSSSKEKDRLGKCFTWIKADSTFRGLKHAIYEYDGRVFLGHRPLKLTKVEGNKTKYVKAISFSKIDGSILDESWFDSIEVSFNKDLVAIIGNKGSGKSALVDSLGLLGHSPQHDYSSFLTENRFRDPRENKASQFTARLLWEDGNFVTTNLSDPVDVTSVERVKYIPQHFLERICNEVPGGEETEFDKEVKKVIFSHVSKTDRLGHTSIDELINDKTSATDAAIEQLKAELSTANDLSIELESKSTDEYRQTLENLLAMQRIELASHEAQRPPEIVKPETDPAQKQQMDQITAQIAAFEAEVVRCHEEIATKYANRDTFARQLVDIQKVLGHLEVLGRQVEAAKTECGPLLKSIGIPVNSIITFKLSTDTLSERETEIRNRKEELDQLLDFENEAGPVFKTNRLADQIRELERSLDEPNKHYQANISDRRTWQARLDDILGNESTPGTLKYCEKQIADLALVPETLAAANNARIEISRAIFKEISKLADSYRQMYKPVQDFIAQHPLAKDVVPLKFQVSIINSRFEAGFLEKVNQRAAGSFLGVGEGSLLLKDLMLRHDFDTESGTMKFLAEIVDHLLLDRRPTKEPEPRRISDQLRKGFTAKDLYDFIFSLGYLEPRYVLKLGDKELHQLSPGEKGSLLLIFYLLVDRSDLPLILDQPDENIDQQTVFNVLIPCVKEAKKNRQILVVTHNPNLAVVCDAEQFVYCSHDKAANNKVSYVSGALENPEFNRRASDVLEGTLPAFDNRNFKYIRAPR
ncbi:MAG: hypothetical protein V3T23_10720 [Nitrososphaerales archaeon]